MSGTTEPAVPFRKMHGLGNDFVVIDARSVDDAHLLALTQAQAHAIADRRTGVGCDQLIIIGPGRSGLADAYMHIRNADGGEVAACGNATRCIAALLMDEAGKDHVIVETNAGLLDAERGRNGLVSVDMGEARLDWREIPVKTPCDTLHVPLSLGPLSDPVGVNIGNPHAVFFVDDAEAVNLAEFGPRLERHEMFPERANISVAEVTGENRIRLRVWERGVGITKACGTGACATMVAAARRGLTARSAEVVLDGGPLAMEWMQDGHVMMTGPWATSFVGSFDRSLIAADASSEVSVLEPTL